MRTSGTQHRRADGQGGRCFRRRLLRHVPAEEFCEIGGDAVRGVLAGCPDIAGQLAADIRPQLIFAADINQRAFDHRIQLFDAQHLIQAFQELGSELFRERERRCDMQDARCVAALKRIGGIGAADAVNGDAAAGFRRDCRCDRIAGIGRKDLGKLRVAPLNIDMRLIGKAREDHPFGGIADEALRLMLFVFLLVPDSYGGIAVADSGGGAEQHGGMVFFGVGKRLADHVICFLHAGGVEAGELGIHGKGARILLGLRGNGAGVVGNEDDHAALDADIGEAHERIGGNIQTDLLHGDHCACTAVGSAGAELQRGFFVDGPFGVKAGDMCFCRCFKNLCGGRAGIAADDIESGGDCTACDGGIAHQEFSMHQVTSFLMFGGCSPPYYCNIIPLFSVLVNRKPYN